MEWKRHRIDLGGGVLTVHERPALRKPGDPPAVPLVLLHGFTGCGRTWDEVAERLPFVRLLAPDLPGHGETRWQAEPSTWRFEVVADRLCAALHRLDVPRCNLAGYSMGGRLALYVAIEFPQRVVRLILESASAGLESEEERRVRREADDALGAFALERGIEAFVRRWEATPVLAEHRLEARTRSKLNAQRLRCRPEGLAASLRGMGTGAQPYLGGRLNECTAPALLIAGKEDAKFRLAAASMHERMPTSRLELVRGAGHNVHVEHPERFASLVTAFAYPEFVRRQEPTGETRFAPMEERESG